jgi:aryl-alcohol dehydrogenase-like predicted oxidoreductase
LLPVCASLGLAFIPYFPLAAGLLSGKYRRDRPVPAKTRLGGTGERSVEEIISESKLGALERLALFAEEHGHSLLELALSWLAARQPVASVIAGAMSAEQVRANAAGVGSWRLTNEELVEVDRLTV